MKKFFLGALAIAGLVACVQEDVLNTPDLRNEIGFGGYVNGSVRSDANPSTTTNTIEHFTVWSYMDDKAGLILENELVEKSGDVWTYANTQYWLAEHQYHFYAITPYGNGKDSHVTIANGANYDCYADYLGTIEFENVDGTEDVLYATADESTVGNSIPESVQFAFDHLLSKVKFTFVNGFTTSNIDIAVTEVTMTAPKNATTTLGKQVHSGYEWTGHAGETVLDFGNIAAGDRIHSLSSGASDNERLTFPAKVDDNLTYTVKFKVAQYVGTQTTPAATYDLESTVTGVEFVAGKAYNFVAEITNETLDLKKIEFKVTVDEWDVEPDFNLGVVGNTEVKVVYSFAELQAVLDDAAARGVSVNAILGADIAGQVKVQEIPGVVTTIDGHNHTLTGAILIDGKSDYKGATTVVKNVNFVADAATLVNGDSFIWCGETFGTNLRYPDNITVENCTFTASGVTAVAVKVWSLGNANHKLNTLTIKDVTATGLHSLAQLTSSHGKVVVDNVTVNAKNGISLGIIGSADIKNSTINAEGYGVRANGCVATTNIENSTISAKQPIVVRKVTKAGYALILGAGVVLNTDEVHQVIFTKDSDDEAYVAPAVEFAYSSVADFIVFPEVSANTVKVSTADELVAALKDGKDVYFLNDITVAASKGGYNKAGILQNKAQTINGGGHTLTATGAGATWDCAIYTNGGTIKNLTVKGAMRGIFTAGQSADLHIENVEFKNVIYTFNSDGDMPANPFGVYVSNSKVNGWTSHSDMHTEVVYTNCSFGEGSGYKYCRPYGKTAFVGCTFCAGYTIDKSQTTDITFTGCTFE